MRAIGPHGSTTATCDWRCADGSQTTSFYRFRHRLNKASSAQSEDNFAKATDYMMVGWRFNDHWTIQGGKKNQSLGSFEYDENTLFD